MEAFIDIMRWTAYNCLKDPCPDVQSYVRLSHQEYALKTSLPKGDTISMHVVSADIQMQNRLVTCSTRRKYDAITGRYTNLLSIEADTGSLIRHHIQCLDSGCGTKSFTRKRNVSYREDEAAGTFQLKTPGWQHYDSSGQKLHNTALPCVETESIT